MSIVVPALALLLAVAAGTPPARAEDDAGAVAAVEGQAEVLHAGAAGWTPLAVGDPVRRGSQVRTLADSKLKLLLNDDSVLTLAASSQLTIDDQVIAPAPTSRFSLFLGSVRAVVTERYGTPGAQFDMETPTAVAGVRGTAFIASYDADADETVVVGLADTTLVRARIDEAGAKAVAIGPGETTTVRRGNYPLQPTVMPDDVLRGFGAATAMVGGGRSPAGAAQGQPQRSRQTGSRTPEDLRDRGSSPEGAVVDQPIGELRDKGRTKPPPPPPPLPSQR
jgi:hypothetical protein